MQLSSGPLLFTRQLGIGEREHVRAGLLGVGFFSPSHILDQIRGAVKAADKLGMMLRIHVNTGMHSPTTLNAINNFMHTCTAHQYEPWSHLSRPEFDSMCRKLEIVIIDGDGDKENYEQATYDGIVGIWNKSGGRFLGGNFAQLTDAELKPLHPQFYYDTEQFWKVW